MINQISIIGQGYVGLPLSLAACEAGYTVVGIDNNSNKIQRLLSGQSGIEDINNSNVAAVLKSGRYSPTSDYKEISKSSVISI